VVVGKGGKTAVPVVEMNTEAIFKKLKEIIDLRGKKSTDKASVIEGLKSLLGITKSAYQKARVLLALIPAQFDISSSAGAGFMPTEAWHRYLFFLSNPKSVWPRISV
jgi:translation initiation factor 3 subunit C